MFDVILTDAHGRPVTPKTTRVEVGGIALDVPDDPRHAPAVDGRALEQTVVHPIPSQAAAWHVVAELVQLANVQAIVINALLREHVQTQRRFEALEAAVLGTRDLGSTTPDPA